MKLTLPDPSLVLLIGVSGSGKSTFARQHFRATEIISSDQCRALICDDEANQEVTRDAFELVHLIAAKRCERRRVTVIDATNVQLAARRSLLDVAERFETPAVAIVFNLPLELCLARNQQRHERRVDPDVIQDQYNNLQQSLSELAAEGFTHLSILSSVEEIAAVVIERELRTETERGA